jgi:hypothetical protein
LTGNQADGFRRCRRAGLSRACNGHRLEGTRDLGSRNDTGAHAQTSQGADQEISNRAR